MAAFEDNLSKSNAELVDYGTNEDIDRKTNEMVGVTEPHHPLLRDSGNNDNYNQDISGYVNDAQVIHPQLQHGCCYSRILIFSLLLLICLILVYLVVITTYLLLQMKSNNTHNYESTLPIGTFILHSSNTQFGDYLLCNGTNIYGYDTKQ